VNTFLAGLDPDPARRLSPERGNVAFASTEMGWCFTLKSFAQMYADEWEGVEADEFARRLWGDVYFDESQRKFGRKAGGEAKRSFVHFVLEPIYKIYSQVSRRTSLFPTFTNSVD
jgi:U5 small nuclear ribonucleoprotein component